MSEKFSSTTESNNHISFRDKILGATAIAAASLAFQAPPAEGIIKDPDNYHPRIEYILNGPINEGHESQGGPKITKYNIAIDIHGRAECNLDISDEESPIENNSVLKLRVEKLKNNKWIKNPDFREFKSVAKLSDDKKHLTGRTGGKIDTLQLRRERMVTPQRIICDTGYTKQKINFRSSDLLGSWLISLY